MERLTGGGEGGGESFSRNCERAHAAFDPPHRSANFAALTAGVADAAVQVVSGGLDLDGMAQLLEASSSSRRRLPLDAVWANRVALA